MNLRIYVCIAVHRNNKCPDCNYNRGGSPPLPPYTDPEISVIYNSNDVWSIYILTQITLISENNCHTYVYLLYILYS